MKFVPTVSAVIAGAAMALPMTFVSSAAIAQTKGDLQRVEISGRKLPVARTDVHAACLGIDTSLQGQLAYISYREEQTATVRVQFRLTGSQLEEVSSTEGPLVYRTAARQAVRRLDCMSDSNEPQLFTFLIRFNGPEQAGMEGSRIALLEQ